MALNFIKFIEVNNLLRTNFKKISFMLSYYPVKMKRLSVRLKTREGHDGVVITKIIS